MILEPARCRSGEDGEKGCRDERHADDLRADVGDDRAERDLLEAAGWVHNVGLFISHSGHHKHSYYVIRHTEQLTGFTDHEIELVAQTARYHRKSLPASKHVPFAELRPEDQQAVRTLAGMVRITIGLDRRHAAAVRTVRVLQEPDGAGGRAEVVIEAVPSHPDDPLTLELHAARERSRLLSIALDVDVRIERGEPI